MKQICHNEKFDNASLDFSSVLCMEDFLMLCKNFLTSEFFVTFLAFMPLALMSDFNM